MRTVQHIGLPRNTVLGNSINRFCDFMLKFFARPVELFFDRPVWVKLNRLYSKKALVVSLLVCTNRNCFSLQRARAIERTANCGLRHPEVFYLQSING